MKIYIGGISQETNTFCPKLTDMDDFRRGYLIEGSCIIDNLSGTNTEISGMVNTLTNSLDVEIIPGVAAWTVASGKIKDQTLMDLVSRLINSIKQSLPADGILLALHGALVSESIEDCEGYILEKVREVVGKETIIVCTLDYHAAVTKKMVELANVLIGFRTYPHNDFEETGAKAAKCIIHLIRNSQNVKAVFQKIPLILPVENTETETGPMSLAMEKIKHLDNDLSVISSSLFCPQPWLDIYDNGVACLIYYTDQREEFYTEYASDIMHSIWDDKEKFFSNYPSVYSFMDEIDKYDKPIIIVDSGDVTTAGGVGDSTEILRAFVDKKLSLKTVLTVVDIDAVKQALQIGEGKSGLVTVGKDSINGYNRKVTIEAIVMSINDTPFTIKGSSFSGVKIKVGKRVLLNINGTLNVILCEYASLIYDPEFLTSIGIDPAEMDVIVQKSHKLFRPAYQRIAQSIVLLDTPGCSDQNISRLPFKRIKRPIYPLDKMI